MIGVVGDIRRVVPETLRGRFELIIFDWDGTAVPDRARAVPQLNAAMASLLDAGIWLAPVTGTSLDHLERQSIRKIPPPSRRRLRVCTNRGSEVWSYDAAGERVALQQRIASREENAMLTRAAERLRAWLAEHGVESRVVYDRLNRRKVDVMPLLEWRDPPKAQVSALIAATTRRLQAAGIERIGDVMRLASEIARDCGLADPRVTSDGKYVEIGLTDKSDSMAWLFGHVVRPNAIAAEAILVIGDEFGDVGGFAGSDERMITPETSGVRLVSVGREPNGVPAGVLHLPGGPDAFLSMLQWQLALRTS